MAKEVEKILEDYKEETKRHFDVVAERLEDRIGIVAEKVASNAEKLTEHDVRFEKIEEKLTEHDVRFNKIDDRLEGIEDTLNIIKLDIEFIKNELRKKVNLEDFAALEKRVSLLEAKLTRQQ